MKSSGTLFSAISEPQPTLKPPNVLHSSRSADRLRPRRILHSATSLPDTPLTTRPSTSQESNLLDHSRLKRAWDDMLNRLFLPSPLLSVLPLYLTSTFVDVRTHSSLQVALPQSTPPEQSCFSLSTTSQNTFDRGFCLLPSTPTNPASSGKTSEHSWGHAHDASSAAMHLNHTVQTIMDCKEAIWKAYENLFGDSCTIMPMVTSSNLRLHNHKHKHKRKEACIDSDLLEPLVRSTRALFESDWFNWVK